MLASSAPLFGKSVYWVYEAYGEGWSVLEGGADEVSSKCFFSSSRRLWIRQCHTKN